jgi:hypothetical protein
MGGITCIPLSERFEGRDILPSIGFPSIYAPKDLDQGMQESLAMLSASANGALDQASTVIGVDEPGLQGCQG